MMNIAKSRLLASLWMAAAVITPASAQPLTFRHAIELALQNSGAVAIATADQERARQGYVQARSLFKPQMTIGSGVAYSIGFPLGAPSILSVSSQSFLVNLAQHDFIRSAQREWNAATQSAVDKRNDVILDTASTYSELDKMTSAINALRLQESAALRIQDIVRQRVQAGVEGQVEITRARLNIARVHMRQAEIQGNADLLRLRLSQLTGLPGDSIETVPDSIPRVEEGPLPPDGVARALDFSPAVKAADQHAEAKSFAARAEHKNSYPAIDLVGQYGLFSKFNNYDQFYKNFERHNAAVGVAIRFPFLNFTQRAVTAIADIDALKARKEADGVKNQVSSETMRLQRVVVQLVAAREVARLEHSIAQVDVEAANAKVESGTATLKDQEDARARESERYSAYLDATFELERAQMQLMRATGDLEKWALKQGP